MPPDYVARPANLLKSNIFNYANYTNPDSSGILEFLANELTASEKKGQRVYIIGHVPSGYDSRNALKNPSALFYSIVRRFAPTTIAGIFFRHTHEDQKLIYYDYAANSTLPNGLRNTTAVDYSKPLMVAYIGPSITPLTGLNAGYSRYAIDAKTFSVVDSQVYFANMSESLTWTTPKWQFEYDARAVYDPMGKWPKTAPMNATFWDGVAQQMASNFTLLARYNLLETKSSVVTKNCTSEACQRQKVCFIRSGSSALSAQNCGSGANGPF